VDDPYAPAAKAGIHRLAIPTPFAVGRVNVYLIEDDPLTLVDAGPNSGSSLDTLEREFVARGHRLEDVGLIVLTHQHIDHLGLVGIVAERSGADVAAIEAAVPLVENYSEEAAANDEFAKALMLRHGISEEVVRALQAVSAAFRGWGAAASVTRVLHDGDRIELADRTLEVLFRPGHSPTDTIFLDSERRMLLSADHLIKHISSNPLASRPRDGSGERPHALIIYLESLRKTRELELDLVLPGHGDPIEDHRALIDQRILGHERRADKLHRLVAERPMTAHELAQSLWGNIAVTQAFLTLSEVLGHMDILVADGRVREVEQDGLAHFESIVEPVG
jgi:glyoxylase-like metal-dependent hydrolase (beta-lactamase superfamily II)